MKKKHKWVPVQLYYFVLLSPNLCWTREYAPNFLEVNHLQGQWNTLSLIYIQVFLERDGSIYRRLVMVPRKKSVRPVVVRALNREIVTCRPIAPNFPDMFLGWYITDLEGVPKNSSGGLPPTPPTNSVGLICSETLTDRITVRKFLHS